MRLNTCDIMSDKYSYTAASTVPIKMLLNENLMESIFSERKIIPVHASLLLTNKCNANCKFCSYAERDKSIELEFNRVKSILDELHSLGCQAITLTGGGSPLMYPKISEVIKYAFDLNIDIGLVTNGIALKTANKSMLERITWCRISFNDDRKFDNNFIEGLDYAVKNGPTVDFAFSHVLSDNPAFEEIAKLINYANKNKFTHIRIVTDIFKPNSEAMGSIKKYMKENKIDDSKVIYQDRNYFTKGANKCYMGLMKPVIDATGNVLVCCGTSYARKDSVKGFDKRFSLGKAEELSDIIKKQKCFDGSLCDVCYYSQYNELLDSLLFGIKHRSFV